MPRWPGFFLLFVTVLLASGVGLVVHIIRHIPGELPTSEKRLPPRGGELESGSLVDPRELRSYLLFAGVADEEVQGREIHENRRLPSLSINHCGELYCYQHRMAFANIPSLLWKGLLGIEDYRFLEHRGVDPRSIARAILANIKSGRAVQGGSTLTQQLVKNLYYSNTKSFWRKFKEAVASIYLEVKYPKEKILEAYFNEVVWGHLQGIRVKGVHAASLFYFAKLPGNLSDYEAAILVGLLKGPALYHPIHRTDNLIKRANLVFRRLQELELFPEKEVAVWSADQWRRWVADLKKREALSHGRALWHALKDPSNYLSSFEQFVFNVKAERIREEAQKRYPQADISVKSILGDLRSEKMFPYYSKHERNRQIALREELHQAGSSIKPILYGLLFELGARPEEEVSLAPLSLSLKSGEWSPREATTTHPEQASLRESLSRSYNRPLIRTAQKIGLSRLESAMEKLFPRLKKPLEEYPAQLLGAMELSLTELFTLYRDFLLRECAAKREGENIVNILSDPTRTTVQNRVGKLLGRQRFFGKTGTSNRGLDNWYVFFDGEMLGVIYLGHEGARRESDFNLYGGSTAFRIFRNFMRDRGRRFNELSCP